MYTEKNENNIRKQANTLIICEPTNKKSVLEREKIEIKIY